MKIQFPNDDEFSAMSESEREEILLAMLSESHKRDFEDPIAKVIEEYEGDDSEELALLIQKTVNMDLPYELCLHIAVLALDDGTLYDKCFEHCDKIAGDYKGNEPKELANIFQESVKREFKVLIPYEALLEEAVWALDDGTLYDKIIEHCDKIAEDYKGNEPEELANLFQESVKQEFNVGMPKEEALKEAMIWMHVKAVDINVHEYVDEFIKSYEGDNPEDLAQKMHLSLLDKFGKSPGIAWCVEEVSVSWSP